jgi:hypothetical protein
LKPIFFKSYEEKAFLSTSQRDREQAQLVPRVAEYHASWVCRPERLTALNSTVGFIELRALNQGIPYLLCSAQLNCD